MSKYSGFFLSLLLALFCLWINLWRYPAVWTMINGTPPTGTAQRTDEEPTRHGKAEPLSVQNNFSPYSGDSQIVTGNDPFGENYSTGPQSRGPTPVVVPVSRPKERDSRPGSGFFRPATLSEPVEIDETGETDNVGELDSADNLGNTNTDAAVQTRYPAVGTAGTAPLSADHPTYAAQK